MKPEFENQDIFNTLTVACPPSDYVPLDINPVYRWVFDPIEQRINFTSQYHKNPDRKDFKRDADKCDALALSMFNNLEGCLSHFERLRKKRLGDLVFVYLGTHIAEGIISKNDGVNQPVPDINGHFNHHPINSQKYESVFKIIHNLK